MDIAFAGVGAVVVRDDAEKAVAVAAPALVGRTDEQGCAMSRWGNTNPFSGSHEALEWSPRRSTRVGQIVDEGNARYQPLRYTFRFKTLTYAGGKQFN